ncbi:uracil-DNA glycosylase [Methylocapsa acidiphila]|uniref:uracil-DNA glycosylase n=1 Tax=Methylocapsa acidiphila TaxID=133552 RepID=UPI0003FFA3DF|nr:uracil-DNA glycosylase [Methylocapsa acidiphila]
MKQAFDAKVVAPTGNKSEPEADCLICPRLASFRASSQAKEPDWHNAPVLNFLVPNARLLIIGLAPGLRGANRTGRPFTGDFAGDLLYETLIDFGFAKGVYRAHADDGLRLIGAAITNAVRCVPPQNKPTPQEINACRPFLSATIATLPDLRAILALGRIAHDSALRALGLKLSGFPFAHGAEHILPGGPSKDLTLFDSYHCSRYNTNTGVLTPGMFRDVFTRLREEIDRPRKCARG